MSHMNYVASSNGSRFGRSLAVLSLVLLYPGYFLYHAIVAFGWVPPVLGGFYGAVSLVLLPMLLVSELHSIATARSRLTRIDVVFYLFCVYIFLVAAMHYFLGTGYQTDPGLFDQSFTIAALWLLNFLIWRNLEIDGKWLRRSLVVSAAFMLFVALLNQERGFFDAQQLASTVVDAEEVATYQGFARSAFVTLTLLLVVMRVRTIVWVFAAGAALMYVLGARSEFVGFLACGLAIVYLRVPKVTLGMFAIPLLVLVAAFMYSNPSPDLLNARIALLLDLEFDASYQQRTDLTMTAIRTIVANPLLGDYGSHLLSGSLGTYSHNALSAWTGFGIIGFAAFVWLSLVSVGTSIRAWRMGWTSREYAALAIGVSTFLLLMAAFAKSTSYPLFSAGWGIAAALLQMRSNSFRGSGMRKVMK